MVLHLFVGERWKIFVSTQIEWIECFFKRNSFDDTRL